MQAMKLLKNSVAPAILACAVFLCSCGEKSPEETAYINKRKSELAVRRAQVLSAENDLKGAIAMLEKAYAENGADPRVSEALANAFAQNGETASAGMFYEAAFDGDNSRADLLIFAANAYEQTDSPEAAINAYEKYLKKNPRDAQILKNLALLLEKNGEYSKALNTYMSAIKAENKNPDTAEAAVIGRLFVKTGNTTQAKLWLEAAIKVCLKENTETRREIYLNLIEVYLARKDMGSLENAVAELEKIDPKIIGERFPTLKANIAEFKHRLAEVDAVLNADKTRRDVELEQERAAAEAKKQEREADAAATPPVKQTNTPTPADEKPRGDNSTASNAENAGNAGNTAASDKQNKQPAPNANAKTDKTDSAPEAARPAQPASKQSVSQKNTPPAKTDSETVSAAEKINGNTSSTPADNTTTTEEKKTPPPALKKPETDFEKNLRLAREAVEKKDKTASVELANKTLAINPFSAPAWETMADAYALNGQFYDAFLAANEAYLIAPDNPKAAFKMLSLAWRSAQRDAFKRNFKTVAEKFPDAPETAFYRAYVCELDGDKPGAKKSFDEFLKFENSDAEMKRAAREYLDNAAKTK